jgi:hypothetical protein
MNQLTIGQTVFWHRECRGLYAAVEYVPGIVKRVGKRVTLEVRTRDGDKKLIAVRSENISAHNKPLGAAVSNGHQGGAT